MKEENIIEIKNLFNCLFIYCDRNRISIIMPIFFLSGALYPLDEVPNFLKTIAQFNPLTYGIDGIRGALTSTNHFPLLADFLIICSLMLLAIAFGSYLFNKVEA